MVKVKLFTCKIKGKSQQYENSVNTLTTYVKIYHYSTTFPHFLLIVNGLAVIEQKKKLYCLRDIKLNRTYICLVLFLGFEERDLREFELHGTGRLHPHPPHLLKGGAEPGG